MPNRTRSIPSVPEARALQESLSQRVIEDDDHGDIRWIAGADVSYDRGSPILYAAFVVLDAQDLRIVETASVTAEASFPYIPGYLSFREIPPLLDAWKKLHHKPQLVVCDGQGRAHPRRFGLACHLGVELDIATLGCAKSPLIGEYRSPGLRRGCRTRMTHNGDVIGEVVRTRDGVKPVFVSVGHRISLESARKWVLRLSRPYRLPITTRASHAEVNRLRRCAKTSSASAESSP